MARYKNIELLDCMILSGKSDEFCEGVSFALEQVDKLPTADVVEVKHGEWLKQNGGFFVLCSLCSKASATKGNYCHSCGAKMDGGKAE